MLHQNNMFTFLNLENVSGCFCFSLILDTIVFVLSGFSFFAIASLNKDAENRVYPLFDLIFMFPFFIYFSANNSILVTKSIMRECGFLSCKNMGLSMKLDEINSRICSCFPVRFFVLVVTSFMNGTKLIRSQNGDIFY